MIWRVFPLAYLAAVLLTACGGGSAPQPKAPEDTPYETGEPSSGATVTADSEVGGMNEEKTQDAFNSSLADLKRCYVTGTQRVEFLAGRVHFAVEINAEGRLEKAYLKESTLGDRQTEQCMLNALRNRQWPKPVGGRVGRADNSFDFEAANEVRLPVEWSVDDIGRTLDDLRPKLNACKSSGRGVFHTTLYVNTDGSVLSAGYATPEGDSIETAGCLLRVLKQGRFPSPGSWPAKVTFEP